MYVYTYRLAHVCMDTLNISSDHFKAYTHDMHKLPTVRRFNIIYISLHLLTRVRSRSHTRLVECARARSHFSNVSAHTQTTFVYNREIT